MSAPFLSDIAADFMRWREDMRPRTCPEAWRKNVDSRMRAEARTRDVGDRRGQIPVDRINEQPLWVLGAMNDFCEQDE